MMKRLLKRALAGGLSRTMLAAVAGAGLAAASRPAQAVEYPVNFGEPVVLSERGRASLGHPASAQGRTVRPGRVIGQLDLGGEHRHGRTCQKDRGARPSQRMVSVPPSSRTRTS